MVLAYHEIGEQIYKACGENDRAEYGASLLQFLSEKLTAEFGQGYTIANLRNMRQFYMTFPNRYTPGAFANWSVRSIRCIISGFWQAGIRPR